MNCAIWCYMPHKWLVYDPINNGNIPDFELWTLIGWNNGNVQKPRSSSMLDDKSDIGARNFHSS